MSTCHLELSLDFLANFAVFDPSSLNYFNTLLDSLPQSIL